MQDYGKRGKGNPQDKQENGKDRRNRKRPVKTILL
jgi:hypothetical protein